ncbi:MAG: DNRLRE domain-containing protein [Clostridia bacterium]|nr:DNRLRE domain-containing protein [Clostridia bacterium]
MKKLLSIFIAAAMLLANTAVWAEDVKELTVSDDTGIVQNTADTPYNDAEELRIHNMGSSANNKEAWLRFDMSAVDIPAGMRVKSAILSVYFLRTGTNNNSANGITATSPVNVWSLTADGYDTTVTWNTNGRPERNAKLATAVLPAKNNWTDPLWLDFDVTAYMRNLTSSKAAFSLYPEEFQVGAYIATKEYENGKYAPKLTVTLEEDPDSIMTILPTADASVDYEDTSSALGGEEMLYDNALFDFSLWSVGDDAPNITDESGYFGVDLTEYVSEHFKADKSCRFYIEGKALAVYSKDNTENKPYMKIIFDGNKIHSATLYLWGSGSGIKVYTASEFDEKSVTAAAMPTLGLAITLGGEGTEFDVTVEGYTSDELNNTYYMALDPKNAYPAVADVYDLSKIPSASEIETMLEGLEHPYLLTDYDGFENIKALKDTDSYMKKWYAEVEADGEGYLSGTPSAYSIKNGGLSSNVDDAAMTLAFLYRTTSDADKKTEYAEKCLEYLAAAVDYKDFNPSKMLNVGEMSRGVALAYDWLYDYDGFSDAEKQAVEQTLVEKALDVIIENKYSNHNNWNIVVNGGVLVAALAVGGADTETAAAAIYQTVSTLPTALRLYYPDGVFIESTGYYGYASSYLGPALSALESTLGTDWGLGDIKGISESGYFPIYTKGHTDNQAISYGDGAMAPISSPFLLYLAERYNNTDYGMYQREADGNNLFSMIWYNPDSYTNAAELSKLSEDYFADGVSQTVSMRDGWDDENALFVGLKGGYNQMSHGDLDIGNFYIGAYGESFTKELEGVDYHSELTTDAPYFRLSRYTYYAKSPQGHNTLVINQPKYYPDMSFGQSLTAKAEFFRTESGEDESFAVLDMTEAYSAEVNSAYRGVKLDKANDRIIISDKISTKKPSDVWWFMHTDADIEVYGNTAILTIGENSIYAEIISETDAEFYVMDEVPLAHTPTVTGFDSVAYVGEQKLAVKLDNVTDEELQICFSLAQNDMSEFEPLLVWGDFYYGETEFPSNEKVTVTPTDDTYSDERNSGANTNDGNSLKVMYANTGYNYETFLRFKPEVNENAELDKVTLTMHAIRNDTINNIAQQAETVTLYPVEGEWAEETLTDNNAPTILTDLPIASATVPYYEGTKTIDEYITFDLTDYYKSLTDKSDISLAIKLTSRKQGCVYFDDKESGVAPSIEIVYKSGIKKTLALPFAETDAKVILCTKTDGVLEDVSIYEFINGECEIELFEKQNLLYVWDSNLSPVYFEVKN